MKCKTCGQTMKFRDGCVMGPYGVNYELSNDPSYVCQCGNVVEVSEPEPPTTSNNKYTATPKSTS